MLEELFIKNYYSFKHIDIFTGKTLGRPCVTAMVRLCQSTVINQYKMVETVTMYLISKCMFLLDKGLWPKY